MIMKVGGGLGLAYCQRGNGAADMTLRVYWLLPTLGIVDNRIALKAILGWLE